MMNRHTILFRNKIVVFVTFISASLILFSPSVNRGFASDDFCILRFLFLQDKLLVPGFFRPIGDLTLKWTYKLSGWDPFYFYLTNILLHAVNSFLVYLFCRKIYPSDEKMSIIFPIAAGVIFLTYPSHGEAIFWTIGRGVSLAVFFSLITMVLMVSKISPVLKYTLVCASYFIALACYESVLLLPLILLVAGWVKDESIKFKKWILLFAITLVVHFIFRYYFSGALWGGYNGIIFSKNITEYSANFIKIVLRSFIPPYNNPLIFSLFGAAVLVLLSILYTINRKKIKADKIFIGIISIALTGMLVTILVAISFGLSTRTSEGDRLLYFPSVFYSILMAVVIVRLSPSLFAAIIFFILLSGFQVYFLSLNQNNWIRASEYSNKIIRGISSQSLRPIYIVNLPMDYKGAFVFRNCLEEALLNNNIDTTGIKIVNVLESAKADQKGSLIVPEEKDGNIFIWPEVSISAINDSTYEVKDNNRRQSVTKDDPVLFWDKEDLRLLRK